MIKAASLFRQLLSNFPRSEFDALARKHDAERGGEGLHLLGPACGDAVLPHGQCGLPAGDLHHREVAKGTLRSLIRSADLTVSDFLAARLEPSAAGGGCRGLIRFGGIT